MARTAGKFFTPGDTIGKNWKYRAIKALRGNQTQLGAVLIAALGKSLEHGPPRYGRHAMITKDGVLAAPFENRAREMFPLCAIGKIDQVRDEFRRLADHIQASDAERAEMMEELRKWVTRDDRAKPAPIE